MQRFGSRGQYYNNEGPDDYIDPSTESATVFNSSPDLWNVLSYWGKAALYTASLLIHRRYLTPLITESAATLFGEEHAEELLDDMEDMGDAFTDAQQDLPTLLQNEARMRFQPTEYHTQQDFVPNEMPQGYYY